MASLTLRPAALAMAVLVILMCASLSCGGSDKNEGILIPADEGVGQDGPVGAGLFVFGQSQAPIATSEYVVGSNPLISWRDLEPQEGMYNWSLLDAAIEAATAAGSKVVPRVLTNGSVYGQPAPDWFFQAESALYYYPSLKAESSGFKAPVPWDPIFQRKFGSFLRALGQRYDGNPAIEFFQTNAGGGLYGEIVLTKDYDRFPPGWTPEVQLQSITFWLDRWLESFPRTELSLMVNHVGDNIGEEAAIYAASQGVYLQQNTPWLPPEGVAIFIAHQESTKIVLEAEDGCNSTGETDFDHLIETAFGYGFAIDYLHLCGDHLWDEGTATRLPSIWQRLRH